MISPGLGEQRSAVQGVISSFDTVISKDVTKARMSEDIGSSAILESKELNMGLCTIAHPRLPVEIGSSLLLECMSCLDNVLRVTLAVKCLDSSSEIY